MIHIVKTKKGQFQAVTISSKNGEVLQASEPETRKANVWKNIFATADEYGNATGFLVQDDTWKNIVVVFACWRKPNRKEVVPNAKPEPRYIAGRNPKTRTK